MVLNCRSYSQDRETLTRLQWTLRSGSSLLLFDIVTLFVLLLRLSELKLTTTWNIYIYFLFFRENKAWRFMRNGYLADGSHEMSSCFPRQKIKLILEYRLLSALRVRILVYITKTCLYNVDLHKPHFYIVKLGFTGVYIVFFLFLRAKT